MAANGQPLTFEVRKLCELDDGLLSGADECASSTSKTLVFDTNSTGFGTHTVGINPRGSGISVSFNFVVTLTDPQSLGCQ